MPRTMTRTAPVEAPGGDAEEEGVGELVADEGLENGADDGQSGADDDAEEDPGQPDVQDDRAERARLRPPGQDVDHLAGRDADGAEGEGGEHGGAEEHGEHAEHQRVAERPPRCGGAAGHEAEAASPAGWSWAASFSTAAGTRTPRTASESGMTAKRLFLMAGTSARAGSVRRRFFFCSTVVAP
ncbi:hypothetical protein SCALM49S_06533 [Streptomyces californicus]